MFVYICLPTVYRPFIIKEENLPIRLVRAHPFTINPMFAEKNIGWKNADFIMNHRLPRTTCQMRMARYDGGGRVNTATVLRFGTPGCCPHIIGEVFIQVLKSELEKHSLVFPTQEELEKEIEEEEADNNSD